MIITPTKGVGNTIIYTVSGDYIDAYGKLQKIEDIKAPERNKIYAQVSSADLDAEVFILQIGTEKRGKIKFEQVRLCL